MSNKRKIEIISSISKKNYDEDYYSFRNKLNNKFIKKNLPDVSEKEEFGCNGKEEFGSNRKEEFRSNGKEEFGSNGKELNKLTKEIENLKEENKRLLKNQKKIFDKLYQICDTQQDILQICKKNYNSEVKAESEVELGISRLNLNSECSYIC